MFDLENAVAEWRRQMLAAGVKSPTPLAELENHLREEMECLARNGLSEQEAFGQAVDKIGKAKLLIPEFRKVGIPFEMRLVKLTGMACGVVSGAFLLWILYVMVGVREVTWGERSGGFLALALAVLSWRYAGQILPAIARQEVRTMIGFLSCAACIGGMVLFINSLPHFLEVPAGTDIPVGRLLVALVWAWTAAAMLAAVACRLEDANHRKDEQHV